MEERIVKKLMTSVKCTGCGQKYEMRDVKILGKPPRPLFSAGNLLLLSQPLHDYRRNQR